MTPTNEEENRGWIEAARREALATWRDRRGVGTMERNGHAVHVRADVERTAAELGRTAVRWEKDVLDRTVTPGAENLIVFRLRGHAWTVVVDGGADAQGLSRTLQTDTIDYAVSDTCGCVGYAWFAGGERVESFTGDEGGGTGGFESKVRSVSHEEREDIWGFVNEFFVARDAFEPGLDYDYFFRCSLGRQEGASRLVLPGPAPTDDRPVIRNPGIEVVIDEEQVLSRPEFERIDFVVMRESPGKAGRILLG